MARSANQSDVARAAGVSISTVSRALSNSRGISDELRVQIQGLAKELGYTGRGVLTVETRLVRTYVTANLMTGGLVAFYSTLVDGMKSAAAAAGLQLEIRLVQQSLDPQRIARDADAVPTAATLLVGVDITPELVQYFGRDRPMVLVNTFDPQMRYDCVAPANFYGAAEATRQLLDAGHRHVMHLREQIRWTTLARQNGFLSAVANVPGATAEVVDSPPDIDTVLHQQARLKASGKARWTGVYAVHDHAAIRFIHALEEVGLRVPRDVSVIGFDDLPAASMMTPRLTTMRVDTDAIGRQAIALLLRRIAEPDACRLQIDCGVVPVAGETVAQISAN